MLVKGLPRFMFSNAPKLISEDPLSLLLRPCYSSGSRAKYAEARDTRRLDG